MFLVERRSSSPVPLRSTWTVLPTVCAHLMTFTRHRHQVPLSVVYVAAEQRSIGKVSQIQFESVVRPGPEHKRTSLNVERVGGYVDATRTLQDDRRRPGDISCIADDRPGVTYQSRQGLIDAVKWKYF